MQLPTSKANAFPDHRKANSFFVLFFFFFMNWVILLGYLISKRKSYNCTFHKNETKVLIDQTDQSGINNLNPHHSQCSLIAAEI